MGKWRETKCSAKRQPAAVEQYELLEFADWLDHSVAFGVAIGVTQVKPGNWDFLFHLLMLFFIPRLLPSPAQLQSFRGIKDCSFLFSEVE